MRFINYTLSKIQFISAVVLFLFGTSILIPPGSAAKQDIWFVMIFATLWSISLFYIYSSLSEFFPGDTIIEYLPKVYGFFWGRLISFFYVTFFILLSALVTRNLVDFMTITVLPETPVAAISIPILLAVSYLLRKDLDVISKVLLILFPILISVYLLATIALIPRLDLNNLLPFFSDDFFTKVIHGFIQASGWPFGEIITLSMIIPFLKNKKEVRSGATIAVILAGLSGIIIFFRNRSVLGESVGVMTYPSLSAIGVVQIPGLGGVEHLIFLVQIVAIFSKLVICYYAATKGISQFLGSENYKIFVFPLLIIIVYLSQIVYESIADSFHFGLDIYPYYLFPLSFVIPLITYLVAKFKKC